MTARLFDYWRSSASYRVRIALGLLGIPFESVTVNLLEAEQRSPENLARNPQGLVPTLEIDGRRMTQSLSIVEYLSETHGDAFMPGDPAGRQRVRALAHVVAMDIHPVCNLSVARHAVEMSGGRIDMADWMRHFIPPGLSAFETMLDAPETGRFCHGDQVTIADICLVPQLYNARRWGIDVTSLSRIREIADRLEALPAFAAAHPDNFKP
ncbi:MAG: maleylacetoacetate isomerase [Alphaproteobacteria bacterium]|nr:MAG: maleylacetoacetate isomerase [Alphaproteobacteria bacterium]